MGMTGTHGPSHPQALVEYFGTLSSDWALDCLKELLVSNMAQNLQLVVNIAKEYTEQLTASKVIELFEAYNSYHGLYFYLGARISFTEVGLLEPGGRAGAGGRGEGGKSWRVHGGDSGAAGAAGERGLQGLWGTGKVGGNAKQQKGCVVLDVCMTLVCAGPHRTPRSTSSTSRRPLAPAT